MSELWVPIIAGVLRLLTELVRRLPPRSRPRQR